MTFRITVHYIKLSVVMLNVVMLSVVMLNVVMLSVVAPANHTFDPSLLTNIRIG